MIQPALFPAPMVGLYPLSMPEANRLLVEWGHRLGPVHRPFHQEAFAVLLNDEPVSLATSGSTVGESAGGLRRGDVVELTRLCSAPTCPWATRVMIRLWRECCAPLWPCWPIIAAVSYSQNAHYRGDVLRFDGWTRIADNVGKSGDGGAWSRKSYATHAAMGSKSLWIWRYPES